MKWLKMVLTIQVSPFAAFTYPEREATELSEPVFPTNEVPSSLPERVPGFPGCASASSQSGPHDCLRDHASTFAMPRAVTKLWRLIPLPS